MVHALESGGDDSKQFESHRRTAPLGANNRKIMKAYNAKRMGSKLKDMSMTRMSSPETSPLGVKTGNSGKILSEQKLFESGIGITFAKKENQKHKEHPTIIQKRPVLNLKVATKDESKSKFSCGVSFLSSPLTKGQSKLLSKQGKDITIST